MPTMLRSCLRGRHIALNGPRPDRGVVGQGAVIEGVGVDSGEALDEVQMIARPSE
jgi:hypothetical protein